MSYAEGSLFDFPLPTNNYDNNKSIFVSSPPIGVRSSSRSPWLLDLLFLFSHLFPPPPLPTLTSTKLLLLLHD